MTTGLSQQESWTPVRRESPPVVLEPARAGAERRFATFVLRPGGRAEPTPGQHFARRLCRDVIRGMMVVALLHLFVVQISVVRGNSMEPCLHDGDRLMVDRLSYAVTDVERFDVVVMRNPADETVDYVKRIVGLPGDKVCLREGHLTVNDRIVEENFAPRWDTDSTKVVEVPDGQYFVLGDNRPISCDSRDFGLVRSDLLKGKVRFRFWPLDRIHVF